MNSENTIEEVYELIKQKRDNALKEITNAPEVEWDYSDISLSGQIKAYEDVLSLIESSDLLEEDKPVEGSTTEAFKRFTNNIRWLQENTCLKTYFENEKLSFKEDLDIIENSLKALEIIKKKGINVDYFQRHCDMEYDDEFNIYRIEEILTREEYDLLKEVLL